MGAAMLCWAQARRTASVSSYCWRKFFLFQLRPAPTNNDDDDDVVVWFGSRRPVDGNTVILFLSSFKTCNKRLLPRSKTHTHTHTLLGPRLLPRAKKTTCDWSDCSAYLILQTILCEYSSQTPSSNRLDVAVVLDCYESFFTLLCSVLLCSSPVLVVVVLDKTLFW